MRRGVIRTDKLLIKGQEVAPITGAKGQKLKRIPVSRNSGHGLAILCQSVWPVVLLCQGVTSIYGTVTSTCCQYRNTV